MELLCPFPICPHGNVINLDIILDKMIIWRLNIEIIESEAFRTFIRVYSLLESERLSAQVKLNPHKALIRSVITYVSPALEFAADAINYSACKTRFSAPLLNFQSAQWPAS
jgi:hypothetical protein